MTDTAFRRNSQIVGSALAVLERMYQGSSGPDTLDPSESRMAKDPFDVLDDFQAVLEAARERIAEEMEPKI